jgi:hypothetical protein
MKDEFFYLLPLSAFGQGRSRGQGPMRQRAEADDREIKEQIFIIGVLS